MRDFGTVSPPVVQCRRGSRGVLLAQDGQAMAHRHRRKFPQVRVELCNCPVRPPVLKLGIPCNAVRPSFRVVIGSVLVCKPSIHTKSTAVDVSKEPSRPNRADMSKVRRNSSVSIFTIVQYGLRGRGGSKSVSLISTLITIPPVSLAAIRSASDAPPCATPSSSMRFAPTPSARPRML